MKTEYEIPEDATHYFLWWDGVHIYKKENGKWMVFILGNWTEAINCSYHKFKWFFGWRLHAGRYTHKLHKITYAV